MANAAVASYDQLAHQVAVLRKENSHLRRELEDNSNHLCKLESETFGMKEVLKQLQCKLEQEAGTLASSGRSDVLHQLKELHVDLTKYYELKHQDHQGHRSHLLADNQGGPAEREDHLALPSCQASPSSSAQQPTRDNVTAIMSPHHFLDGAPPKTAVFSGADGRLSDHHMDELYKERNQLLGEIDREERERCWYSTQLEALSQKLTHLPRIDTFSLQMDLIRQQLEFEVQQVRRIMEERFGSGEQTMHRAQMRVAHLEQLEKELRETQGSQESQLQLLGAERPPVGEPESNTTACADGMTDGGSKAEMIFWLLSMLGNRDRDEMSRTLLALSSSQDSCIAMRKSGCVPLLVQMLHQDAGGPGEARCSRDAKSRAGAALHNIIYSQQDEGQARREMRVLHMLEQLRTYCDSGWDWIENHTETRITNIPEPVDPQICQATCAIMKLSFEEEFRRAMNELGALHVVAELIDLDQQMHGTHSGMHDLINTALRRYAGMALTNLTFGDVVNKATLCSRKSCLQALVAQLGSDSEELHQVVSSILRNLSWRADISSKRVLRDIGCVSALMTCALQATKESTLKSLLSALWNLSAHSLDNKEAVCAVDGALGFLVSTLTYHCQTNSLAIIESGGGILRNVSNLVASRENYRQVLRDHNCLQTLLQHLRSHSLTIVSNACGTLWNLSARSPKDQELLWDLGAVSMLRNLIHSKHKTIAMGSAAALRNLLSNRPPKYRDASVLSPGSCVPSLYMRKQRALEAELDAKHLAETFDSLAERSPKHLSFTKQLRHIESLAKDYASDSGCFEDEEAPVSCSLDTATLSMLSTYLSNSDSLENHKRDSEPGQDLERSRPLSDEVMSTAAEKLAKKITNTVAKIDRLVEDMSMHTSSEDSFSLSSEDHLADWPYGSKELNESCAKSCSPCRLSDTTNSVHCQRLSRAHALLRLKSACTSVSTDSLNSGSTSDVFCGGKDRVGPALKLCIPQKRPDRLDLEVAHHNVQHALLSQQDLPERDSVDGKDKMGLELFDSDAEKKQDPPAQTPVSVSTKVSSDISMASVNISPSYLQVPLIQSFAKYGVAKTSMGDQASEETRRQAWVPTAGSISKFSPVTSGRSPTVGTIETVQKYSVENTPICFSRCSSLSSLSSGDGALDGPSDNELESDSSLEMIQAGDDVQRAEEDETLEDLSDSQLLLTDFPSQESHPIPIMCPDKRENVFLRRSSPVVLEDTSPSSSSENYIHETPLVMSRCSSVSSLGSFESPSIASSIQSDPCSEMNDGAISPSDLPDSPGQTMPPSRSKTPCCVEFNGGEVHSVSSAAQWENTLRKFIEVSDSKDRFNLPPDLDTMIYFTVEKPSENFSCASSLSALPLHEHYVEKDVELKLTPLLQQRDRNLALQDQKDQAEKYSEGNSDDDIEILKECINSAMPSGFRKVRPSLVTSVAPQFLTSQKALHLPVYMMLPNGKTQLYPGRRTVVPHNHVKFDDSAVTDSADGTPVNFSRATSLSDETLQHPVKDCPSRPLAKERILDEEAKRIQDLRLFSHFHRANKMRPPPLLLLPPPSPVVCSDHTSKHVIPTQKVLMQSKEVADRVASQRNRQDSPGQRKKVKCQSAAGKLPKPVLNHKAENSLHQRRHAAQKSPSLDETKHFYQDKSKVASRSHTREESRTSLSTSMTNIVRSPAKPIGFHVLKQKLMDGFPASSSLSSSVSSLSDAESGDHRYKTQQICSKDRHNKSLHMMQQAKSSTVCRHVDALQSSPSSLSVDSEDDLLHKCITSAMPKQRRKMAARKKKAENGQKPKEVWNINEDSDDPAWDQASDLNSVEWRAIQEGANAVVTGLQAAKSQEFSSEESESVLSFMSTSSFTPKEKKFAQDKKANKPLDFAQRKPVPNLPVVFRGRTVIYTPIKETAPSQIPPPRKVASPKNPELAQHRSKSLHRLGRPQDTELYLPKRSSTPPPRIPHSSSSGSSQSSTPSKHSQKKLTSRTIQKKNSTLSSSPHERKGRSLVVTKVEKTPPPKTQKSPVRIPFMKNSVRPARPLSPLITHQATGRQNQVGGKRVLPTSPTDLHRVSPAHSYDGESDASGFLRQLTFIKDSKSGLKRECMPRVHKSRSQNASPHQAASAVFLCSSRCQELKVAAQPPRKMTATSTGQAQRVHRPQLQARIASRERDLSTRRPSRRTSSERPNKAAQQNAPGKVWGDRQQQQQHKETSKTFHASSPSINTLSRVTSRSSLRSSSSDSSARAKSEHDTKKKSPRTCMNDGVTWRRFKDEDVAQLLKSSLPPNALPLVPSPDKAKPSLSLTEKMQTILPASRSVSDATVQTEEFSNTKINSSTSPSAESTAAILEDAAGRELFRKSSAIAGGENFQDGESDGTTSTAKPDGHVGGAVHFRHVSPSKAARVSPFNYVPSPMVQLEAPGTKADHKTDNRSQS
ncbi:adenomatous polyposis coli protein 2 [Syngnathus typhle]|uniref:adenomatous polyposis coli protein 2 n=1 Tax=Syngnathus typhle TaxID=161592 RepID=UPI002A6B4F61|nr:adenomatous polyposis coli protein 2 [Syngnathus typhle]